MTERVRDPLMVAIGKRMHQAALAAGFKVARDIAERMEVSNQTIYRYWNGDFTQIPPRQMEDYAEIVRVPAEWLWTGRGADGVESLPEVTDFHERQSEMAADLVLAVFERIMEGRRFSEAWDEVSPAPEKLSPHARQALDLVTDPVRDALLQKAGGDWESLSDEDRQAVLEQAVSMVKHLRRR